MAWTPGAWVEARRAVEATIRDHRPRVLSGLFRVLGDLQLAEDALQDAVAVALERWPADGVPRNPTGWIVTVARRKALDRLRRRTTRRTKSTEVALVAQLERDEASVDDPPEIPDERLALMFTCCHPALSEQARVALTLRLLGGLSTPEIARCFLVPEATLAQRIVRAKKKISAAGVPFRVPPRALLSERLSSVLAVLYLVFNEGYAARSGALVRADLCDEAIRLTGILAELMPDEPEVLGLQALLLLHDGRRAARVGAGGGLVTLEDQDRRLWDRARIAEGAALVQRALRARAIGPYQLQAAIAAIHGEAEQAKDTDWWQIVGLYTALHRILPTPVVALNRAVAVAMAAGPAQGLALLDAPQIAVPLADYLWWHAARADLLRRLGDAAHAAAAYERALRLVTNDIERSYLAARLAACRAIATT